MLDCHYRRDAHRLKNEHLPLRSNGFGYRFLRPCGCRFESGQGYVEWNGVPPEEGLRVRSDAEKVYIVSVIVNGDVFGVITVGASVTFYIMARWSSG